MDPEQQKLEKYLQDLKEIKDLTKRHEEKPLVEYWDFLSWGVLVIAGTLLHTAFLPLKLNTALLFIWLPIFITGGAVETLAWVVMIRKLQTPISSRRYLRLYISLLIVFSGVCFTFFYLIHLQGPIAGLMLVLLAMLFAMIVQLSYLALIVETLATLLAGILLTLLDLRGVTVTALVGIFTGVMFIIMGFHARALERRSGKQA